jgi:hypothetical protein
MQRLGNDSDGTIGNAMKKIGYKLLYYCGMVYKRALAETAKRYFKFITSRLYKRSFALPGWIGYSEAF